MSREEQVFPDVVLIDGGKGQLNAAREAFQALFVEPPCLISLAKQEEVIFRQDEPDPLRLSRSSAALRLLQYVRDEAHRFAQHYHHLLTRKKLEADRGDQHDEAGSG
jgi:excinuclease ABC subunit C